MLLDYTAHTFPKSKDCTPNPEHCGGDGGCQAGSHYIVNTVYIYHKVTLHF